ncbi:MAG: Type II methyltransferase M2-DpnII [Succiniclasticum sp.]|jgi:site-specific DNA-methyltransferase (adenine-specific)
MKELLLQPIEPYYVTEHEMLLLGDTFTMLPAIKPASIDMIFADPPYFLSNGGITCQAGKQVSVDKGDWDKAPTFEEKHAFNRKWIRLCKPLLKPNGTIWISGTLHNIYSVGVALEQEGFKILNNITWVKSNPPPNLACRCFTHSTETILWAQLDSRKAKHYFNYDLMKELNGGKQMKDVWEGTLTPQKEKKWGKHPTQKPLYLLERIIQASTRDGETILDPFCGSSTTGVAAKRLGRNYIGIDSSQEFIELSKKRLEEEPVYAKLF